MINTLYMFFFLLIYCYEKCVLKKSTKRFKNPNFLNLKCYKYLKNVLEFILVATLYLCCFKKRKFTKHSCSYFSNTLFLINLYIRCFFVLFYGIYLLCKENHVNYNSMIKSYTFPLHSTRIQYKIRCMTLRQVFNFISLE